MIRNMTPVVSLVLLLILGNSASAQILWDGGGREDLWSIAANWSPDTVPTRVDAASIDQPANAHCIIQDGIDAVCETLRVGNAGVTTYLDIKGGSLSASGAYIGVDDVGGHGILNMSGGRFSTGSLQIGWRGTGTLNMTGGVIELSDDLIVPGLTGTGAVKLRGGTIHASALQLTSASGSLDVGAGTLILAGDDTAAVQAYIDSGWITAYGGQGRLHLDYDVTNKGRTTLTATPLLEPRPADGALVSPGAVTLSWTLPDPCVPGAPVRVDVYFTDDLTALEKFTDPAAIRVVTGGKTTSVVVQTKAKTWYYWAVDVYVGGQKDPIYGPVFRFFADNIPPKVDAGADVATWLEGGVRRGSLKGTVTDDGAPGACTVHWTVVKEPSKGAAAIEKATAEDTSVTLTALGEYVLQLEAFDGEYSGSDTITIHVYNNSCEAARSLPTYKPLVGDLNGDCRVDDLDLALLQKNWLQDNSLTQEWFEID